MSHNDWAPVLDYFCNVCETAWKGRSASHSDDTFRWEYTSQSDDSPNERGFALIASTKAGNSRFKMTLTSFGGHFVVKNSEAKPIGPTVIIRKEGSSFQAFIDKYDSPEGATFAPTSDTTKPSFDYLVSMILMDVK